MARDSEVASTSQSAAVKLKLFLRFKMALAHRPADSMGEVRVIQFMPNSPADSVLYPLTTFIKALGPATVDSHPDTHFTVG